MTDRITNKMLEARVKWLNEVMGTPTEPYSDIDGKWTANIGNYHISGAYGGVSLCRMSNPSGGISDVFQCGHIPRRDLFNRICAFMDGIEAAK